MARSKQVMVAAVGAVLVLAAAPRSAAADGPGFLRMFSKDQQAADKRQPRKLSEIDGPWMILAASFAGDQGREQAERLADELTRQFDLPTFIHSENFDFTGALNEPSEDGRVVRYANGTRYQAYAVLAGEYDSVDHPRLLNDLKRIKSYHAAVFQDDPSADGSATEAETPLDAVKKIQRGILKRVGRGSEGPMRSAFATTNPLLPQEFFMIPEVDSFVAEMNSQANHSLLDNPSKFTVVVATFNGFSSILGIRASELEPSSDRMNACALNADKMTRELRKLGVEAYQFHDREQSIVTIGGFDRLGEMGADGEFQYSDEIRRVMDKYCAGDEMVQTSLGPKLKANGIANLPYDVHPKPIIVPRKSKRSIYAGRFPMR